MSCLVCRSLSMLTNSWTVICSSGHQGHYKHVTAAVHRHLWGYWKISFREQSLFIRWSVWTILGGSTICLYRYCGGQFLKPLSLGAVNLSLKHLVVKKKVKVKKTKQNKWINNFENLNSSKHLSVKDMRVRGDIQYNV
jgi:hypothetical protein